MSSTPLQEKWTEDLGADYLGVVSNFMNGSLYTSEMATAISAWESACDFSSWNLADNENYGVEYISNTEGDITKCFISDDDTYYLPLSFGLTNADYSDIGEYEAVFTGVSVDEEPLTLSGGALTLSFTNVKIEETENGKVAYGLLDMTSLIELLPPDVTFANIGYISFELEEINGIDGEGAVPLPIVDGKLPQIFDVFNTHEV